MPFLDQVWGLLEDKNIISFERTELDSFSLPLLPPLCPSTFLILAPTTLKKLITAARGGTRGCDEVGHDPSSPPKMIFFIVWSINLSVLLMIVSHSVYIY
jgi:hypothetical protein